MSKSAYPLKMPNSIKAAAARLAKADGVSLNHFISVAVAEKIGALEAAEAFFAQRAGQASPADLVRFLDNAPDAEADPQDRLTQVE